MKEIHGIADAKRCAALSSAVQDVLVEDGDGEVRLALSTSSYPAGLTPEHADFVARQLQKSAERVRAAARKALRAAKTDRPSSNQNEGQESNG